MSRKFSFLKIKNKIPFYIFPIYDVSINKVLQGCIKLKAIIQPRLLASFFFVKMPQIGCPW
jgi:hypothetical protein